MAKERESSPSERGDSPTGESPVLEGIQTERELIVIVKHEVRLQVTKEGVASIEGADVTPLADLFASEGISMRPLFGVAEERLKYKAASLASETGVEVPDLSVYYRVDAPDERLDELAERLRKMEIVEAAYVKPPVELPQILNDMIPTAEEPPVETPDFTLRQGYLDAAPGGIDARYAWTQPGGGGGPGVSIIDIEGAWRFTHEDLMLNQGGVVGGTQSTFLAWRNHGTAVIGEIGGDWGSFGITGICPAANVRAISIFGGMGTAGAIRRAADMLNAGDIILIELHRPGPRFDFQNRNDQRGYIAIEWWPDDFDAIRYATTRGVIVVEAAGNGAENLDDTIYNTRPAVFPTSWTNPFNHTNRDSGAIVVGAGAPPPETHGRNHGPDRSRLDFSNFGALLDAQGWGREVTTSGYGDLQGGNNEDEWYTDRFSGTSSASPIVVGAIACVQGILRRRESFLPPSQVRALLHATGSPQQDAHGRPRTQRIGNRPNLREMIERVGAQELTVPLYRYWNGGAADHFYTTSWNELGSGRYGWAYEGIQCYVYPRPFMSQLSIGEKVIPETFRVEPEIRPPGGVGAIPETFMVEQIRPPGGVGAIPETFMVLGGRSPFM
jgi:subtilisin family serine protease